MIIGLGTDIVDVRRIKALHEKSGDKFLVRIFTKNEIAESKKYSGKRYYSYLAKRFAAKEAASKALGTGIGKNMFFTDAEISSISSGQPILTLSGRAAEYLLSITPKGKVSHIHLSLSDDGQIAHATVIIST